jgi:hypothetical protein
VVFKTNRVSICQATLSLGPCLLLEGTDEEIVPFDAQPKPLRQA